MASAQLAHTDESGQVQQTLWATDSSTQRFVRLRDLAAG